MRNKQIYAITIILISICILVCYVFFLNTTMLRTPADNRVCDIPDNLGQYYVKVDVENELLPDEIYSIQRESDILVFLPKYLEDSRIKYSVYTSWDELISEDYILFEPGCERKIGSQVLKFIAPSMPMLMINTDKDKYKEFSRIIDTEYDKTLSLDVNTYYFDVNGNKPLGGASSIHLRGNGTSVGYTKPYSLKFDKGTYLFDGKKAKKYNLLANWQDKTLLKNQVFFKLANDIGLEYTPDCKNVILYINGDIQGIYTLTSKVNVSKNTVDLHDGDFLINWFTDGSEHSMKFNSDSWCEIYGNDKSNCYDVIFPDDNDMDEIIENKINEFVEIIEGRSENKIENVIDVDSFVKYYWIMEVSMDFDAGYGTYSYYKKSTDKLYMGPIWDMDLSLGANGIKSEVSFEDCLGWKARKLGFWSPFFEDKEFCDAVNDYYPIVREKIFDSLVYFENEGKKISFEGNVNFQLKRDEQETYGIIYNASSYDEQVEKVCDWYRKRIEWIDNEMVQY